jgi:hypothetical protein
MTPGPHLSVREKGKKVTVQEESRVGRGPIAGLGRIVASGLFLSFLPFFFFLFLFSYFLYNFCILNPN